MPSREAQLHFPFWFLWSSNPDSSFWSERVIWANDQFLGSLLDAIDGELDMRGAVPLEQLSDVAAALLYDLSKINVSTPSENVSEQLEYSRFYVSTQMAMAALSRGRFAIAFDWFTCSLTDLEFRRIAAGSRVDFVTHQGRLVKFLNSAHPIIKANAPRFVFLWIDQLFYYARKTGGHQSLVQDVFPLALEIVQRALPVTAGEEQTRCISAACQMASWAATTCHPVANELANLLLNAFTTAPLSLESRKNVGITMMGHVGLLVGLNLSEVARSLLTEDLGWTPHERLQLIVGAYATLEELNDEVLARIFEAAEAHVADVRNRSQGDYVSFCFGQIRLFDIIAPLVATLAGQNAATAIVKLFGIWFDVPADRRRVAPVVVVCPTQPRGVYFCSDRAHHFIEHDTRARLEAVTVATNEGLGTAIMISEDPTIVPEPADRTPSQDLAVNERLEHALSAFYGIQEGIANYESIAQNVSGMLVYPGLQHCIQALLLKAGGTPLPMVTSFEQPLPNRAIRKALLLTVGTYSGPYAVQGVSDFLNSKGVVCDVRIITTFLSPEDFQNLYQNPTYDLLWIEAHGEFNPAEPHFSKIVLGWEGTSAVSLDSLVRTSVSGEARRLLLLNICEGGTPFVFNAPAKMGIAPLLASREQAVISHLWPTLSQIAPVFGLLLAIGLVERNGDFFEGFKFALGALRMTRDELIPLLQERAPTAKAITDRLFSGSGAFAEEAIVTWGSPIFYE